MTTKVALTNVRLSFPVLWTAEQYEGKGTYRYSASFLVLPGSANDKAIEAAILVEAKAKFTTRADVMLESFRGNGNKFCYMKGDLKDYDGYEGMMVLTSHRKKDSGRPVVRSEKNTPLAEEDGIVFAGCYVNASVEVYAQSGTNAGIRCGLLGVQFVAIGDAFSAGSKPTEKDFSDITEGASVDDIV